MPMSEEILEVREAQNQIDAEITRNRKVTENVYWTHKIVSIE